MRLILDTCAARKTAAAKRRPAGHPRFRVLVTPTSASRIRVLEGRFDTPTRRRLARSGVRPIIAPNQAIRACLDAAPRPVRRTTPADSISGRA